MKIQSVRGTRDFYPEDMAFRQWLTDCWRAASRRAGFVEVDGPELEPLELYTEKSGAEIAEQLYWLTDKSDRKLALRPEFTPTLARMIAARQAALPEPIRWFNISRCFRYERAQKGRLREFFQWNVDLVGVEGEIADAECISIAVDAMQDVGPRAARREVQINDRRLLGALMRNLDIAGRPSSESVRRYWTSEARCRRKVLSRCWQRRAGLGQEAKGLERILILTETGQILEHGFWRRPRSGRGSQVSAEPLRHAGAYGLRIGMRLT